MDGAYVAERAGMDYAYFPRYDLEPVRQAAQDAIVAGLLADKAPEGEPWVTYLCGAYGAGKSHSVRQLWPAYVRGHVYIDPDAIKCQLGHCAGATRELHLEATFVALLAERAALARGLSIVVDGSLHDHLWYSKYLNEVRRDHPAYNQCLVHVSCPNQVTVLTRCEARGRLTGRTIPPDLVLSIFRRIPDAFQRLRSLFDCTVIVDNASRPTITHIDAQHAPGQTWPPFPPFLHKN